MGKKKRNFEGYKRQGKRFIPPMKQLPQMREYSYVNDMLPELIWLGLIHDRAGYRFGARTLEIVVEITKDMPIPEKSFNCALQIAYADLSNDVKSTIVRHWDQEGMLETIRDAIAPLVLLYDGFSLAFVGPPSNVLSEEALINRISSSVANHLDKTETPGVVLHGTLLLTRLMARTITFAQEIPDLNAVVDEPDSDEAQMAASFMRVHAGAEWAMLEIPNDWARHFWNRNAELSDCERSNYLREDD